MRQQHHPKRLRRLLGVAGLAALLGLGCADVAADRADKAEPEPPAKKVKVGPNVELEVQGKKRRVLVSATVCLRKGQLEQLLCRKNTKEHEAILSADVDARKIHEALILAGAVEGSPVRFVPRYRPASGTPIKISLRYEEKGKQVTVSARSWVKNAKTGQDLDSDWVFAGSQLVPNPFDKTKPKMYLANDGDVICVSNFETAMLDLPIRSSKDAADLAYEAHTERIPPVDTKVTVILEPVPPKKK
jgi:hypothetical protein